MTVDELPTATGAPTPASPTPAASATRTTLAAIWDRISRNPIYLSGLLLSLGLAVLLGSLIPFFFPIALFLILDRLYIPSEEKRLAETFGQPYLDYKKSVRRWF